MRVTVVDIVLSIDRKPTTLLNMGRTWENMNLPSKMRFSVQRLVHPVLDPRFKERFEGRS